LYVEIAGPHAIKRGVAGSIEYVESSPLRAIAATLGDALAVYQKHFGVAICPYDGSAADYPIPEDEIPKYFWYRSSDSADQVLDIHIRRGTELICPKQDLGFLLIDGDSVEIGVARAC